MRYNLIKVVAIIIAGIFWVSCSHDNLVEPGSEWVCFESGNVVNSRTVINSISDMKIEGNSFGVFGDYYKTDIARQLRVFDNEKVTYGEGSWSYDVLKMWSVGMSYNFRAIYPYCDMSNASPLYSASCSFGTTHSYQVLNFTVDPVVENQVDLMVSDVVSRGPIKALDQPDNQREIVSFTFSHILSNVNLRIYKAPGIDYDMKLLTVRLVGMYNSGSCYNGVWHTAGELDSESGYYRAFDINEGYLVQKSAANGSDGMIWENGLLLVPQNVTSDMHLVVDFQITKEVEGSTTKRVYNKRTILNLPTTNSWSSGTKINYTAEITSDETIIFDAPTVTPWIQSLSGGMIIIK